MIFKINRILNPIINLDRKDLIFSNSGRSCFTPIYFGGDIIGYFKFIKHISHYNKDTDKWIYAGKFTEAQFKENLKAINE